MPRPTVVVVPCYNEAARLDRAAFLAWAASAADTQTSLLFVDDGSTDATADVLSGLAAAAPRRCRVLSLPSNVGKAEAVRRGLLAAAAAVGAGGAVGYWDADLATPLDAVAEFQSVLDSAAGFEMVFGARVALLGRHIRRRLARHYLGRVFATLAANLLGLPIYDTQCGAKLFRVTDDFATAVATPFRCRWTFDVELIARFVQLKRDRAPAQRAEALIYELPLQRWTDVPGSKLGLLGAARMGMELLSIANTYYLRCAWPPQRGEGLVRAPVAAMDDTARRGASPRARGRR